jgi:excisionase family DNA binding protein
MQKRTSRTHSRRTKHRRAVQNGAANRAAIALSDPALASSVEMISSAQAARRLGVDVRTIRRYIEQGKLRASRTPGNHVRILLADVEAKIHPNVSNPTAATVSNFLQTKKQQVEELNLDLQAEKAKAALRELRQESESASRREEEAEQSAQQQQRDEDRRRRSEAVADAERRRQDRTDAQARSRAEAARRDWEDEKLHVALGSLPHGVPEEIILDVTEAVQEKLQTLSEYDEALVDRVVSVIARQICRPYMRRTEIDRAAAEALLELPMLARSYLGRPTEWQLRARELAAGAVSKLPDGATFEEMSCVARVIGKQVAEEYAHSEKSTWRLNGVRSSLAGLLAYSSNPERAKAEQAVRSAFSQLRVGANDFEFNAARDEALAPFLRAEADAKTAQEAAAAKSRVAREAEEAKRKIERDADLHLYRVSSYLVELEADQDGWDFEGKRYELSEKIKRAIRESLIQELPLSPIAAQERVEELVDEWLAREDLMARLPHEVHG